MKHLKVTSLLIILMSMVGVKASAYDAYINGIYYSFLDGNAIVTHNYPLNSSIDYSGDIIIPNIINYNGKEYSVTGIDDDAFQSCKNLNTITIPYSISIIGDNAFIGCSGLSSVEIPNSVISIGSHAFSGCSGLTLIKIPNNVKAIGESAFYGCTSLSSIIIPSSIANIGNYAFDKCVNLTTVTCEVAEPPVISSTTFSNQANIALRVPAEGKEIYASHNYWKLCKSIDAYDIHSINSNGVDMTFKITSLNDKTAQIGSGKESAIPAEYSGTLTIPASVTLNGVQYEVNSIADSAFINCNKLTSVEIPSSIKASGNDAFRFCTGLRKVIARDLSAWCNIAFANKFGNPVYYANHFYSDDNTEITDLVIPEDVNTIGNYSFVKCQLNSVTVQGKKERFGNEAFYKCTGLKSVIITNGVDYIRSYAFYGCSALTSISFPESLKRIGGHAFYGCTSLKEIELPENLTGIDGLTGIGDYAFKECSSLKTVKSNILLPSNLGVESFSTIAPDCILYIPVGTLSSYTSSGWTKAIFYGGIIETGEVHENFCLENDVTAEFINNVTYPNDDYSFTKITDYCTRATTYRQDLPQPVRIESPIIFDGDSLLLEIYTGDNLVRKDTFPAGQRALDIWNLTPKTLYTYKIFVHDSKGIKKEIGNGKFKTTGQVRMVNIPEMHNFRDIGGWKLPSNKHVKYGRLYRSAELEKSWKRYIEPKGIDELLNVLKIDVEIDFGVVDGSPIEQYVDFVRGEDYQILPYSNGLKTTGTQYKNCFEKVVNSLRMGKNVLFHCSEGADRTGTFAFLLEGLIGVSESDLAKDFELTCLYLDSLYIENKRYRNTIGYSGLINNIKTSFDGKTINEKIEQMALNWGISSKDIEDFRFLMTIDDNVLYGKEIQGLSGRKVVFPIELANEDEVRLCQFDLRLPDGVTVATKSNGKLDAKLTERAESHSVSATRLGNGDYRFVVSSLDNDSFTGNSGALMEITLDIAETMEAGEYTVKVLNTELSVPDGNDLIVVRPADTEATLTVKSYTPGDVNSDGSVSVTDVGCAINYILEQVPSTFVFEAADMNQDGTVSVTDVGIIINLILSDGAASRKEGNEVATNKDEFIGFQFDVKLAEGATIGDMKLTGGSDHLLTYRQLAGGTWRVVCYSPTNSTFATSIAELLSFKSEDIVAVSNIRLTTADFEELRPSDLTFSPTGIASVKEGIRMNVQGGILSISSDRETTLPVYSLDGRVCRNLFVKKGQNRFDGLRPGIYMINNQKVMIR